MMQPNITLKQVGLFAVAAFLFTLSCRIVHP